MILSAGFAGCNLRCPFCQNYHISQTKNPPGSYMPSEELAALARERGFEQIAYTYSEPLIHIEFLLDCMAAARNAGIANVLVSSGCVTPEAASLIMPLIDAANIDLKCFSQAAYTRILEGDMAAVLAFIRAAFERGVHLEVTTLITPGLNDVKEELESAAAFLARSSPRIPWHLSACHPAWKWNGPPPQPRFLADAAVRARKTLAFVYTGNTPGESSTQCPSCGALLVRRRAYCIDTQGLRLKDGAYYCGYCGVAAPFKR
jgi:pyruvate formate lyase activating enzyme